jgi:hypothetical protein
MLDQPIGAEPPQTFAHRSAADRKTGRQVAFDEARSGLEAPGPNLLAQALDNEGDGRAMRRRDRRRAQFPRPRRPAPSFNLSHCGV